ncbi:hypothetical protein QYF36_017332 [Acer negundo]|nr:hypothetical protein QYF36_017332 [Acer negundo]
MLTIEDYYVQLFPRYHPSRVLTLVYQPFALETLAILAYKEAKINTRKRNLFGYGLFFISSLLVLVLDLATSGKGGIRTFIEICVISGTFRLVDAHVQRGMVGDQSFMTPELVQCWFGCIKGFNLYFKKIHDHIVWGHGICVLTSAPKGYKGPKQNALGNLLALFLLGGIFAGVTLDWLWLIGK